MAGFKTNNRKYCIFLLLVLLAGLLHAQSIQFKNYTEKEGLPSLEVYNVMQDSKGYMWFCSDAGVSCFDGYRFKNFSLSSGLPDNTIFEAREDYKGKIWFRSYSGKISYYYNDSIYTLPVNDTLIKILQGNKVISMSIDSQDNIYLGTMANCGYIKINIKNKYAISVVSLPNGSVYLALIPGNGIINGAQVNVNTWKSKKTLPLPTLYKIDVTGLPATRLKTYDSLDPSTSYVHNKAIRVADGRIAASFQSNFAVLDKNYNISFSHDFKSVILDLVADAKNRIWVITADDEPVCYSEGKLLRFKALDFLKSKRISSMKMDNEGGYWFTSLYDGVYYLHSLDFRTWDSENGLPGNKIQLVKMAPDSSLWVTVFRDNKLTVLNHDTISYRSLPDLPGLSVFDILFNTDKSVWVSTSHGMYRFKGLRANTPAISPIYRSCLGTVLNPDGTVWTYTPSTIDLLNTKDSAILLKRLLFNSIVVNISPIADNGLLISTFRGLWEYSMGALSYLGDKFPILTHHIGHTIALNDGSIWMVNDGNGIDILQGNKVNHINVANGLISNTATHLCQDYKGNIWVGTRQGLSCIVVNHTNNGELRITSIKNISEPCLNDVNYITCVGPVVYVATNTGLTSFNMGNLSDDTTITPVYLTGLKVNAREVYKGNKRIDFNYDQNYIMISYVGLNYIDAGKVLYRYKMSGLDTGWIYTRNTEIQYPKLPPGTYTFSVSAMNHNGLWNMHPATVELNIKPPWWSTWWARSLAIGFIASLIYWRIKTVQTNERRKAEIKRQLTLAELQKIKAQFNPHFLFNNLNTLSSLITAAPKDAQEFTDELSHFYQYTIEHSKSEFTKLHNEIKQAERYFSLLKIRFGDNLNIVWNIDRGYSDYYILSNSLQILLENIVKHNNIVSGTPLHIKISSTVSTTLQVINEIRLKRSTNSTGTGLTSLRDRYRLLSGKEINISRSADFFSVELPLITPEEYESINNRR